jgi:hypothetical protein
LSGDSAFSNLRTGQRLEANVRDEKYVLWLSASWAESDDTAERPHQGRPMIIAPPESEDDLRNLIEANTRPWTSFWAWRDKPIGEHGAATEILQRAGVDVVDFTARPQNEDPPDCEGRLDGQWSGVEVTELVHRKTLERSIKALKQRAAGREPALPEAYFVWDRDDLIAAIQVLIEGKDVAKLKGGP